MSKEQALAAKARGNELFAKGEFAKAAEAFTEAITHDPTDAVFYSNRSGAYASLKKFDEALADANKCVELNPKFIKGYSRQGVALFGLQRWADAKTAYKQGLEVDPNSDALKQGLADTEAREAQQQRPPPMSGGDPFGQLFGPDMWVKLNADPTTREYMKDPAFVSKLQMLQKDPKAMTNLMMSDQRMSKVFGVLLGVDLSAMGKGEGPRPAAAAAASGAPGGAHVEDEDMDSDDDESMVKEEKTKSKSSAQEPPKPAEPAKELTEEEKAELAAKEAAAKEKAEADRKKAAIRADADKEKGLGNDAYKKRDFATAITHYTRALEIDPSNIVYYNNLSAVYMEQKDFAKAIEVATRGAAIGKEHMANYADVAKAYARIGTAYHQQGDLERALEFLNKSLLEDYNDKTRALLKKIEEEKRKAAELAYIDPALSEEHKAKGNELYNAGKFADAIQEYTEAIKRDPKNYKVYSNRAACYTKMMDWQRGLEDCEKCLAVDPKFVKAYIRKGKIQHFLKQYHKALSTFDAALELDAGNSEVMEAKRATLIAIQSSDSDPERAKEALKDPEIQGILRDPTISKVLADMQQNPQAGAAAMRDPDIRKKIEKLIAAGVLGVK